jgi:nucleoid-associated protein YgaU
MPYEDDMGWGQRLGLATAIVLVGSAAAASPAGVNGFVPVTIGEAPQAGTVVVEPGDHLWKISATHLDQALGRPARPEDIDPYWRAVIDVNREHLVSGDPDLIYPGEVIQLPDADPG